MRKNYTKEEKKVKKMASDKAYRVLNAEKRKKYAREYYKLNKSKMLSQMSEYYHSNKDEVKNRISIYQKSNRGKINTSRTERLKVDIHFRLACNLRERIRIALKGDYKRGSAVRDLGCSILELKQYIESQFVVGMSWDNWSPDGWHIDHIVPLAYFDLSNPEQFKQACHFTNLQPLWATDNFSKNAKLFTGKKALNQFLLYN